MKKHTSIFFFTLAAILAGCGNKEEITVNNEFELSTYELAFECEESSRTVNVIHDVSSNAWGVRCALDDWWCTYTQSGDELIVSVSRNDSGADRTTYAEVVIGGNSKRIDISQKAFEIPPHEDVDEPIKLPDTLWDTTETEL